MPGLPTPILRVPPTTGGRANLAARLRQRLGVVLADVRLPATRDQIIGAGERGGVDQITRVVLRGLTRPSYRRLGDIVDEIKDDPSAYLLLLGQSTAGGQSQSGSIRGVE